MHGKLFLLAVVCVSFVQVRGDAELDNKIKEAIEYVKRILINRSSEANFFESYVRRTFDQYEIRNEENLAEAAQQEMLMKNFLEDMADLFYKEVQTSDQSSCIDKAYKTSRQKLGSITLKLRSSLKAQKILLDEHRIPMIKDVDKIERKTRWEYNTFENRIKSCTEVGDVENLVWYYENLSYVVKRYIRKTDKEFQSMAKTYEQKLEQICHNYREEMENLKTVPLEEMRKCVYPNAAVSGRTAFLQLISKH